MPTSTHTHVITTFANPFLVCGTCHDHPRGYVSFEGQADGCTHRGNLVPCGHSGDVHSECPSWSPVDGCRCMAHLGYVGHPVQ